MISDNMSSTRPKRILIPESASPRRSTRIRVKNETSNSGVFPSYFFGSFSREEVKKGETGKKKNVRINDNFFVT